MRCRLALVVVVVLSLALFVTPAAYAAEQVPSSHYASWSKYKPGTTVTLKQQMKMGGMTIQVQTHQELAEITPEQAVVQVWTVTNAMGTTQTSPKKPVTLPAMVNKGEEDVPPGYDGKIEMLGDEKVTVGGKEYDCKVMRFTGKQQGMNASGKMWGSDAVPVRTVKLQMKITGETDMEITGETDMEMTGELAKVVIKK